MRELNIIESGAGGAVEAGGATAGQRVYLNHDGVYSYFETIPEAEEVAAANDTLTIFGTHDVAGIGKDGVGYFFMPGSGVTYTGQESLGIFDDKMTAMSFRVGGDGAFLRHSSAQYLDGGVIRLMRTSTVYFECTSLESQTIGSPIATQWSSLLFLDVEKLTSAQIGLSVNGAKIRGKIAEMNCPNERAVSISGSDPGDIFLEIGKLSAMYWAFDIGNPQMTSFIRVSKVTTTLAEFPAIKVSAGTLYLDIQGEVVSASHALEVTGGTATIEGRMKTTGTDKHCIVKSGGTLRIEGGSTLIANGTGKSIWSADAQNVVLLGDVAANADVEDPGVKITTRVGSLKIDATYVN